MTMKKSIYAGVCVDVELPDVQFNPQGYLLLSSKDGANVMEHDHKMQT